MDAYLLLGDWTGEVVTDCPPPLTRRLDGPSRECGLIFGGALFGMILNFCRTRSLEKPRLRLLKDVKDDPKLACGLDGKLMWFSDDWL